MEEFINACDPYAPTRFENITSIKLYGLDEKKASRTLIIHNEYVKTAHLENGQLKLIMELQDGILDLKERLETLSELFITINCNSVLNEYILMMEIDEFIEMGFLFPSFAILTFDVQGYNISFNTVSDTINYYSAIQ